MTFKHKLSRRLALLRDALVFVVVSTTACELRRPSTGPTDPEGVTQLRVTPKTLALYTDQTTELIAVGLTAAGDTGDIAVSWSVTGGTLVDTSTAGGRHYGRYKSGSQPGQYKIAARGNTGGMADTATVTVNPVPVASVALDPVAASVTVGQSTQLTATPKDSAGTPLAGRTVTWASNAPAIATVNSSGLVTGVVTGSATITATSETKSGSSSVTVTNVPVASVTMSPATASVAVGGTTPFVATVRDAAGGILTGRVITWASTNAAVATVSATGVATGVAVGSASIIATSEGKSDTSLVTVVIVPVGSVTVTPATASVTVGGTTPFVATVRDAAGGILTGRVITWASTNAAVATVSATGVATGVAVGSASIIATSEGKSDTSLVTVIIVPIGSVTVTPATASVTVGGTTLFTATVRDAAGGTLTGRVITWASTNPAVATASATGVATGVAVGSASIIATSEGKSDASTLTVTAPPPPSGAVPDPTLLPVASGQAPNVVAYNALSIPSQPAGFSYNDPVTNVKIWKVTSSTVPAANSSAGHDYADAGNRVSLGWGPNNNTHTILIRGDGMAYYLVDFTRGVGFSNYRLLTTQPLRDLCFSFSNLASQPRIAYIINASGVLVRYNTQTMQLENTGYFPRDVSGAFNTWLQHDKNDVWFVGLANNTTAFAWNSQTNQYLTHSEIWMNELRLERDGRYAAFTSGTNPSRVRLWDLSINTFGPDQTSSTFLFFHNASLRGHWLSTNVNASSPFAQDRYFVSGGQMAETQILAQSAGPSVHHAGNWIQSDAELPGGDLNKQWSFLSGFTDAWAGVLWQMAVGVQRSDGSDQRLLLHHYSVSPTYWAIPWGTPSPDGKVVLFNSNMNGSGRYDLFIAEMPLR